MANISKIELGDTTYNIKDAIARSAVEAITDYDEDGNIYVNTNSLKVTNNITANHDIYCANNITANHDIYCANNNIDRDGSNPSNTVWTTGMGMLDKDGKWITFLQGGQTADGTSIGRIRTMAENSLGIELQNYIAVKVDKNGTKSYEVGDPSAFRTAIGAQVAGNYATYTNGMNAAFGNVTQSNQIWAVGAKCINTANTTMNNHTSSLVVSNDYVGLWDATSQTSKWIAYTTANKPTYSDVGAAAANHTHSYLPLSGGTLTGNLINKANYYQNGANFAAGTTNSTKNNIWNGGIYLKDKNSFTIHELDTYQDVNGVVWGRRVVQNLPTATSAESERKAGQISIGVAKDGTVSYSVSSPANFRSAIGAAAASHTHNAASDITGTLGVAHGGTGIATNPSMLVNLASTAADTVLKEKPRPGVTGTLPITHGGTGATTAAAARAALGAQAAGSYATTNNSGYINADSYTETTDRDFIIGAGTVTNTKSTLKGHSTSLYVGTERIWLYDGTNQKTQWSALTNLHGSNTATSAANSYFEKLNWKWVNIGGFKIAFASGKTKSISLGTSVATNALWGLLKLPLPIPSGIFTAAPLGLVGSLDTVVKIQPSEHQNWTSTTAKVDIVSDSQRSAASTYYISLVLWGS